MNLYKLDLAKYSFIQFLKAAIVTACIRFNFVECKIKRNLNFTI